MKQKPFYEGMLEYHVYSCHVGNVGRLSESKKVNCVKLLARSINSSSLCNSLKESDA